MNIRPFSSIKTDTGWYKMIKYIGMGGNGTAFLVMCTAGPYKGELFAMKVFHNILDDVRRERFLSEIISKEVLIFNKLMYLLIDVPVCSLNKRQRYPLDM